jgi:hypothetical protein
MNLAPVKGKVGVFQHGNAEETFGQSTDFQEWRRGRGILRKRTGDGRRASPFVVLHRSAHD